MKENKKETVTIELNRSIVKLFEETMADRKSVEKLRSDVIKMGSLPFPEVCCNEFKVLCLKKEALEIENNRACVVLCKMLYQMIVEEMKNGNA